jgi:hypothetical protein
MGLKVFVSYKYKDEKVQKLQNSFYEEKDNQEQWVFRNTRVRDYVNILQDLIGREHINLGEKDGESLEDFSDLDIETELKKKIFQSSTTIVLISKGMKTTDSEKDQWIPWEISYSLRSIKRENKSSRQNALLGVVLPDENGTYDWYYKSNPGCNSITHFTNQLFWILRVNMFNIRDKQLRECEGSKIHTSNEPSFIKTVKWIDFNTSSFNSYLDQAVDIREDQKKNDTYDVKVNLKE